MVYYIICTGLLYHMYIVYERSAVCGCMWVKSILCVGVCRCSVCRSSVLLESKSESVV